MRMSLSLAVFAVAGSLWGCAGTTESQKGTTEPGQSMSTEISVGSDPGRPLGSRPEVESDTVGGKTHSDSKRSVYYEFDRYDVRPEYRGLVETHARWLRANPNARLTIEGNTDEHGSREYNVALGQRRAESVTALMVLMGVKREQIEAVSFGKEKPRAVGHDEAAWAVNRRSDFDER